MGWVGADKGGGGLREGRNTSDTREGWVGGVGEVYPYLLHVMCLRVPKRSFF